MSVVAVDVLPCPPELRAYAAALVLGDLAPSQRSEIGRELLDDAHASRSAIRGVARGPYVALRDGQLCGAAWGQFQPGNTAVFWPPRFDAGVADPSIRKRLAHAALNSLDEAGVTMTQVLLPAPDAPDVPLLQACGFRYLADLVYLSCERDKFSAPSPQSSELEFVPYDESQRARLAELIERTYEGTLDCAALGGERRVDDVIDGYQATGEFRPSNWFFVRSIDSTSSRRADVGALLLADHPAARHIELVYMGLVPSARGRGWGPQIVRQAQQVAKSMDRDRIVLAVDAANQPALAVYHGAQFVAWDQRSVFLRFLHGRAPARTTAT
jgi:ribosomal protein S18 acetylase RimI-like enzyme